MFFEELPYGGFKQSGFGKELGKEGLFEYTCLKNVTADATEGAKPLVNCQRISDNTSITLRLNEKL
jgi:hypothetical protein